MNTEENKTMFAIKKELGFIIGTIFCPIKIHKNDKIYEIKNESVFLKETIIKQYDQSIKKHDMNHFRNNQNNQNRL